MIYDFSGLKHCVIVFLHPLGKPREAPWLSFPSRFEAIKKASYYEIPIKSNAAVGVELFDLGALLPVGARMYGAYCATLTFWGPDS